MDWYLDRSASNAGRRLRHEVEAYLRRHVSDEARDGVAAAVVVVDELVSNAIRHADGPIWVGLDWSRQFPRVVVQDLGPDFDIPEGVPPFEAESGRGLFLAGALGDDLRKAAKRAGGKRVSARLRVPRAVETSFDPPRNNVDALPALAEAEAGGGFGRETFLRALVVQLARTVESQHGPKAAEAAVSQVGVDVGGRMEEEYRQALEVVGEMSAEQIADCLVRLKTHIEGDFYPIEVTPDRIVLGNRRCPFGEAVKRAPALCRMTSSVFGGIAARNTGGASVVLEERIAVGDPECRVVIHLGHETPVELRSTAHRYSAPVA